MPYRLSDHDTGAYMPVTFAERAHNVLHRLTLPRHLVQFTDSQTYVRTIHQLALKPPCTILVVSSLVLQGIALRLTLTHIEIPQPDWTNHALNKNPELSHNLDAPGIISCIEETFCIDVTVTKRSAWNSQEGQSSRNV